ncbi:MAG: CBS domain-containing protein, partial [Methermicoccaceae archaeon]
DISGLPVVENDGLLGVITMTDLVRHISTLNIDIEVSDVMEDFVPTVHRHHSMQHVVECMEENSTDRVVVLEDSGSPVGIITNSNVAMVELDVLLNKFEGGKEITTKMGAREGESRYRYVKNLPIVAEDIMTPTLIFTRADEQLNEAAASMIEHEIRGMPVVDDKGLVGLLTERNIITVLIKEG